MQQDTLKQSRCLCPPIVGGGAGVAAGSFAALYANNPPQQLGTPAFMVKTLPPKTAKTGARVHREKRSCINIIPLHSLLVLVLPDPASLEAMAADEKALQLLRRRSK